MKNKFIEIITTILICLLILLLDYLFYWYKLPVLLLIFPLIIASSYLISLFIFKKSNIEKRKEIGKLTRLIIVIVACIGTLPFIYDFTLNDYTFFGIQDILRPLYFLTYIFLSITMLVLSFLFYFLYKNKTKKLKNNEIPFDIDEQREKNVIKTISIYLLILIICITLYLCKLPGLLFVFPTILAIIYLISLLIFRETNIAQREKVGSLTRPLAVVFASCITCFLSLALDINWLNSDKHIKLLEIDIASSIVCYFSYKNKTKKLKNNEMSHDKKVIIEKKSDEILFDKKISVEKEKNKIKIENNRYKGKKNKYIISDFLFIIISALIILYFIFIIVPIGEQGNFFNEEINPRVDLVTKYKMMVNPIFWGYLIYCNLKICNVNKYMKFFVYPITAITFFISLIFFLSTYGGSAIWLLFFILPIAPLIFYLNIKLIKKMKNILKINNT